MNVLLIVSGGIAAYKAIDLSSSLVKKGHDVRVVLTYNAKNFVTELPFQTLTKNRVYSSTFNELNEKEIQHIDLTKWADKIVVAPATANIISKFANGIADDLTTSLMLAVKDFSKVFIVPAMNTAMYNNPIIRSNMDKLANLGFNFVEPDSGLLACGDIGEGKFPSIEKIEARVFLSENLDLKGKKVLVTAGPTKEFIDPFRCLTNPSTGKMGIAIANEFANRGAEVTLVTSVETNTIKSNVKIVKITSTNDMFEAVRKNFKYCDYIVKAAAVSDYTPVQVFDKKVKKQEGHLTIEFERTQDILKYVGVNKQKHQKVIGFAAETNNLIDYAKEKIIKKNLDFIIANDISNKDIGFGSDNNEVYIIDKFDNITKIDKTTKINIAKEIVNKITK